jgi:Spy/CpxP family protein refolding chaperone
MTRGRWLLLIAVVAFLASLCGVLAARHFFVAERPSETEVHKLLHEQLKLSPEQHSKIEALEKQHAIRKRAMELEMRAANARLAAAIEAEHGYGTQVTAAVDHIHHVMGEMQKETLQHLFAMRGALTPEQARTFDATVTKALTGEVK